MRAACRPPTCRCCTQRDRFCGRRRAVESNIIRPNPSWEKGRVRAMFGIHRRLFRWRKGILGWPQTYPVVDQARVYVSCLVQTRCRVWAGLSDQRHWTVAQSWLANFRRRRAEGKISRRPDGRPTWSSLTPRRPVHDREGRPCSDVRQADDNRRKGRRSLAPDLGAKWFCSNADCQGRHAGLGCGPQGAEGGTRGVGLFLMPARSRRLARPIITGSCG